jgi:tyrosinase
MIHTYVDKLWWEWQAKDLDFRLTDMGGRNVPTDAYRNALGLPEVTDEWLARETTLDHVLDIGGVYPTATIRDVMDIQGGFLCYEYV